MRIMTGSWFSLAVCLLFRDHFQSLVDQWLAEEDEPIQCHLSDELNECQWIHAWENSGMLIVTVGLLDGNEKSAFLTMDAWEHLKRQGERAIVIAEAKE